MIDSTTIDSTFDFHRWALIWQNPVANFANNSSRFNAGIETSADFLDVNRRRMFSSRCKFSNECVCAAAHGWIHPELGFFSCLFSNKSGQLLRNSLRPSCKSLHWMFTLGVKKAKIIESSQSQFGRVRVLRTCFLSWCQAQLRLLRFHS